jgi:hypothetical protein
MRVGGGMGRIMLAVAESQKVELQWELLRNFEEVL